MTKKLIGVLLTSFIFIGIVACSNDDNVNDNGNDENQEAVNAPGESNEDPIAGEELESVLDPEDYPDVIAEVNGVELDKDTFIASLEQEIMMMQVQGMDIESEEFTQQLALLEQETVDRFVNQETIYQAAVEEGLEATEAEIDEELEVVMVQNQMESEEQLIEVLEQQGMSLDEFREDIGTVIAIEKYIDQQIEVDSITDEDVQSEYEKLVAELEESGEDTEIPSFEEVEGDIRQYLEGQLQEEQLAILIEQLKEDSDITINI